MRRRSTGRSCGSCDRDLLATAVNSFSKAAIALMVKMRPVGLLVAGLVLSSNAVGAPPGLLTITFENELRS